MRTLPLSALVLLFATGTATNESTFPRAGSVLMDANVTRVPRGVTTPDNSAAAHRRLPLSFEANHGQTEPEVRFISRGRGYGLFLTPTAATVSMNGAASSAAAPVAMRMQFVGSNPKARIIGEAILPGVSNYFIGRDPAKWRTHVPHYAQVRYEETYPGIDLVFYGNDEGRLEYDVIVAPGADPRAVRLGFEGVDGLEIDARGDLVLRIAVPGARDAAAGERTVRLEKPRIHQETTGGRQEIAGRYVLGGGAARQVHFEIGPYDVNATLVIDPVLIYSTYLGGGGDLTYYPTGMDGGMSIAADATGNAYVTGFTDSLWFPMAGPLQPDLGGQYLDAFVTKFDPTGSALVYSTFLGGFSEDYGYGIAVDEEGSAYVTGYTGSPDFPTTSGAFQPATGSSGDAFVAKLNAAGDALVYSSFLGGSDADGAGAIAVAADHSAYLTGSTYSTDFPTTAGAVQPAFGGGRDAFVARVNAAGTALAYSTYLGGSLDDVGTAVAVDAAGDAFVAGLTLSDGFPTTAGAFDTTCGTDAQCNRAFDPNTGATVGSRDAFVTALNPPGSSFIYSTFLGGGSGDFATGIAVDALGDVSLTGTTNSSDFPVTAGAFQPSLAGGWGDVFVTRLNSAASGLVYSTFLGGSSYDSGRGIAVDSTGNPHVTGYTSSSDFPTANPIQAAFAGTGDAFVTKLNPEGTAPVYSTYLGGGGGDEGAGIALDSSGNVYIVGYTESPDFPVTPGAFQVLPAFSTDGMCCSEPFVSDAFVAKIGPAAAPGIAIAPAALSFGDQQIGTASEARAIVLMATGSEPLPITGIEATGDFAQTNDCGGLVASWTSCTIAVTFMPTAVGLRTGDITITHGAGGGLRVLPLDGAGIDPQIALSPPSLTFGDQPVGTTSAAQTISVSNPGSNDVTLWNITATGDFRVTPACSNPLVPGATCTLSVAFSPTASGPRTGSITVEGNDVGSPHVVSVTGNGTGSAPIVELSPADLRFGFFPVGVTSPPQSIILSNIGTAVLTIFGIATSGDFAQTNTCGATVAAGGSCVVNVTFAPTAEGSRPGVLTITDDATGSPRAASLHGWGTAPTIPPTASFTHTCAGLTCGFDATGSSDGDGNVMAWAWDFGDGMTGSGPTVNHTFAAAGTYTVTLKVTDNEWATGSTSKSLSVGLTSHVADLDRSSTSNGNTWTAVVTITVHDANHNAVTGATVAGAWSDGASGSSSCMTGASGQCAVSKASIPKRTASARFTVSNVTHSSMTYNSAGNHDPDGDSNGTAISVLKH